jgi:hypothetical protein
MDVSAFIKTNIRLNSHKGIIAEKRSYDCKQKEFLYQQNCVVRDI